MIIKSDRLAEIVKNGADSNGDVFSIIPAPDYNDLSRLGEASIELRLGRWFTGLRQLRTRGLSLRGGDDDELLSERHFVPFGGEFVLHPGRFILGATLEWITLPSSMAAYVTGKSSLGRRGLIIETAAGVHPGFSGCLTLEFANLGEVPLEITPGMKICQVFFHETTKGKDITRSRFSGHRCPTLGGIKKDEILEKLKRSI